MGNKIIICFAVILVIALLGLLAYNYLEIYDKKDYISPSREYYNNNFLALQQWLIEIGHPVRNEIKITPEEIAATEEKVILINSNVCEWEEAYELIYPWIENGGYLVLNLYITRHETDNNTELINFLSNFGISFTFIDYEDLPKNIPDDQTIPYFRDNICFNYDGNDKLFTINDKYGYTKLLEIPIGDGALTVSDGFRFMNNYNLNEDINAELAWRLTGARANGENTGVVFVEEKYDYNSKSLFGELWERGNLLPVGISLSLLIFIGFWSVIPVFGLVLFEKEKNSRPIKERFAAEILFLKKYKTLNHYLAVYNRDKKIEVDSETEKEYNYSDLINQYRRIFDGTAKL